jgi:hypothetical protein
MILGFFRRRTRGMAMLLFIAASKRKLINWLGSPDSIDLQAYQLSDHLHRTENLEPASTFQTKHDIQVDLSSPWYLETRCTYPSLYE